MVHDKLPSSGSMTRKGDPSFCKARLNAEDRRRATVRFLSILNFLSSCLSCSNSGAAVEEKKKIEKIRNY